MDVRFRNMKMKKATKGLYYINIRISGQPNSPSYGCALQECEDEKGDEGLVLLSFVMLLMVNFCDASRLGMASQTLEVNKRLSRLNKTPLKYIQVTLSIPSHFLLVLLFLFGMGGGVVGRVVCVVCML